MLFLAEQHLAAAKLVRRNGAERAETDRERFITMSNSFVVCVRLAAKHRGGICLDNFEEVAIAIAHELSHIVLFGINHSLQECEEAVDLAAMLLGYRDLYIAGSFCEVRPASFWERLNLFIEKRVTGVERRTYRTLGYLTPEEVKYAAVILAMPSRNFNVNR